MSESLLAPLATLSAVVTDGASTPPLQLAAATMEVTALLAGAAILFRVAFTPRLRLAWQRPSGLPPWRVAAFEFLALATCMVLLAILGQSVASAVFGDWLRTAPDRDGLTVVIFGIGFHATPLLAWPVCRVVLQSLSPDLEPEPQLTAFDGPPAVAWSRSLRLGAITFLVALPLLALAVLGWNAALHTLGLPEEPQDLIGTFAHTRSPGVIAAMLLVACVIAPINEELIFRRCLFRFCRDRLGRWAAYTISACCFSALHRNWFSLVPLAVFGLILALAYDLTGDVRVPIVAHALFNLNTIACILAGFPS